MTQFRESRYYSAIHDAEMIRLSMADHRGAEFYMIVPVEPRKGWADSSVWPKGADAARIIPGRRSEALDSLEAAIKQGCNPGEVRVMETA